ncbi:hypothetical protein Poli38472_009626 [Pythium oligandrum]|uniref:Fe2OG dioxygenase domain-containing protein n=1 Tax=Pythium oligandrum TaxID=41045 RepID=A0A8K1CFM0_PYTOL|nr:hypothetical protein Poli38472_009626 [Pythium oligandrum]|eukprot:TMW62133.1 hypothetical protein Poli38472_009626 [Pythium oligandrum]
MSTAQSLVSKCHLAPYGHGEDTTVDREVRNTWELNAATEFSLLNPAWQPFIDRLTTTCARALGIDTNSHNVTAKLYKLLVYEVGGKFEVHHDSEKALGMFGSLVIVLPSPFMGGELVIHGPGGRHNESFEWDPSLKSSFGLQYAAFYGDCEHEVKPVTSGYRVCLTYNLMTSPSDLDELPKVDTSTAVFEEYLASYCASETKGRNGVYLGRTEYTELSEDRTKVELISRAPYIVYGESIGHALLKTTSAICEDDDEENRESYNVATQVTPVGYFKEYEWVEDEQRHVPYTGNEGDYSEYWYASAALIVMPVEENLKLTAWRYGMKYAVDDWLKLESGDPNVFRQCANALFHQYGNWSTSDDAFVDATDVLLHKFHDTDLILSMLDECSMIGYQPRLASAMNTIGWDKLETVIGMARRGASSMNLVASLLTEATPEDSREMLLNIDALRPPSPTTGNPYGKLPNVSTLHRLFKATYPYSKAIIESWVAIEYWEMLVVLIVPAFVMFSKTLDSIPEDVGGWLTNLLEKVEAGVPEPGSWTLWVPSSWWVGCCAGCDKLAAFLRSPTARTHTIVGTRAHFTRYYFAFVTAADLMAVGLTDFKWNKLEKKATQEEWQTKALDQVAALRRLTADCERGGKRQKLAV